MLSQITPVLLTYNEERNIGRTMSHLTWASDIVVVDSGSTDRTVAVLKELPNVRIFERTFDTHADQWRYATGSTGIGTDWILRLDADYQLTDALISELAHLQPGAAINAYRIKFDYAVFSRKLHSSLYPPNTILLRRGHFSVREKGHTETWEVDGPIGTLKAHVIHDDWKATSDWLRSQVRYTQREFEWMALAKPGLVRSLRNRPPLMPFVVFLYCFFGKGLFLNGRAGVFYALQRLVVESVLSLMLLEQKLRGEAADKNSGDA